MATALDIIKSSLRLIRVIDSNETPSATDAQDALFALNAMLGMWSAQTNTIFRMAEISAPLVAGQGTYTVGAGGDIPHVITRIDEAYTRLSTTDIELWIYSEQQYQDIPNKADQGRPIVLNYYRDQSIRIWPVPSQAYTLRLIALVPFSEVALNDTIVYPVEYAQFLRYALARDVCSEFGRGLWNEELEAKFREASSSVKAMNLSQSITPVRFHLPGTDRKDVWFRLRNFPS